MTKTPAFFDFPKTFVNYLDIFRVYHIQTGILNSVIIAGAATVISVFLALLAAYGFTRFRFKRQGFLVSWFLSLRMLPAVGIVIPFYVLLRELHLLATHYGLILAYLTFSVPLALWFLIGFIREIPRELDEAAVLDGCSHWQVFWHIIVPVGRPAIAVSAIFTFIFAWNEFLLALILGGDRVRTLPVMLSAFIVPTKLAWGQMAAASILVLIPLLVVIYFLQSFIVTGMTAGAVKGGGR